MSDATVQLEVRVKDLARAELQKLQSETKAVATQMGKDLEQAGRGAAVIQREAQGALRTILELGTGIGVAFSATGLIQLVGQAIADYAKDVGAADRNLQILINRQEQYGASSRDLTDRLRAQADRLASATNPQNRDKTTANDLIGQALGLNGSQIEEAVSLAKQLSDAYGVEAPKAMRTVALAMQGTRQGFDLLGEATGRLIRDTKDVEAAFRVLPRQLELANLKIREQGFSFLESKLQENLGSGILSAQGTEKVTADLKQARIDLDYTRQLIRAVSEDIQSLKGERLPSPAAVAAQEAADNAAKIGEKFEQIANQARASTPFADLPARLRQIDSSVQVEINQLVEAFRKAQQELAKVSSEDLAKAGSSGTLFPVGAEERLRAQLEEAQQAVENRARVRKDRLVEEDQRQRDAEEQRRIAQAERETERLLREEERRKREEDRILAEAERERQRADQERLRRAIQIGEMISDRIVDAWQQYRDGAISASQAVKVATESILRDLARLAARQAATAIAGAILGGGGKKSALDGGIFYNGDSGMLRTGGGWGLGSPMSASRFSAAYGNTPTTFDGGGFLVSSPTRVGPNAVAGEAGLEAVVPLKRGKLVAQVVGGGGQSVTIAPVFNIQAADTSGAEAVVARASKTVVGIIQDELTRNRRFQESVRNA